jgi:hypothetical protein
MPWDLAISDHGDLIFAPGKDLSYVDGVQLMNQRIINRLRIRRGSWIFNRDSSLGSDLDSVMGRPQEQQLENIPHLIQEALTPMEDEIDVHDIQVTPATRGVTVLIEYTLVQPDIPPDTLEPNTVELLIPVLGVSQ